MFFNNAILFYNVLNPFIPMFILCHYIILLFSVHCDLFLYRVCNSGQKAHVPYPFPNAGILQALSYVCIPTKIILGLLLPEYKEF